MSGKRMTLPPEFKSLSNDAKAVGGAWFGMMHPATSSGLIFHMKEHRPSPRSQAALDELVAAHLIVREPYNKFGGIVYKPCVTFGPLLAWMFVRRDKPEFSFKLIEPIPQKEATR